MSASAIVIRPVAATAPPKRGWVFLDKDGTIIEDLPYNIDPRRVRFAPGSIQALQLLAEHGWPVSVVSNQSGVARGYWPVDALLAFGQFLVGELMELGLQVGGFYACPHLPDGVNEYAISCTCRKPAPGLIEQAASDVAADLGASWLVGDTWMDVAAGRAAGCRTILVGPEWQRTWTYPAVGRPHHAVPNLLEAARIVVDETPIAEMHILGTEIGEPQAPAAPAAASA